MMLGKQNGNHRDQVTMISLDALVPKNHLLRKIDAVMDFEYIYNLVQDLYVVDNGRPSIDPVVIIKIAIIKYLFGIRSIRQTFKEIETNVAYRWFLNIGLEEPLPHFSTFGKNYVKRFGETEVFTQIFNRILYQACDAGYVNPEEVFIDGSHIKASANKNKRMKVIVKQEGRIFTEALEAEINAQREAEGLAPIKKKEENNPKEKILTKSPVDPDAGMFYKDHFNRMFCYSVNTACDRNGFVLGMHLSSGNIHDSVNFDPLLTDVTRRFPEIKAIVADAGYITPHIAKTCLDRGIRPMLPYKRPMTGKGLFRRHEYVYDEHYDEYLCPANERLHLTGIRKDGYRYYVSDPKVCEHCKHLSQCTRSSNHQKVITRHVWRSALEEAEHLRHSRYNRELYSLRKETVERVFADMKEKHGLRYTHYRGLGKVHSEVMLTFACMNLKKLATWQWQGA